MYSIIDNLFKKCLFCSSLSLLQYSRYRRDARCMEEEEEMYFDQDDEMEDSDSITSDLIKSTDKIDHFKLLESTRGKIRNEDC